MQNLSRGNDFYYHANRTHFHKKGLAPGLVLKVIVFGNRKWPIARSNGFKSLHIDNGGTVKHLPCSLKMGRVFCYFNSNGHVSSR